MWRWYGPPEKHRQSVSLFTADRRLTYAALRWLFSVFGEFGQGIAPTYTWEEATAGIIAEAIHFPLAVISTKRLVGLKDAPRPPPRTTEERGYIAGVKAFIQSDHGQRTGRRPKGGGR